jgi:hypothetical protein
MATGSMTMAVANDVAKVVGSGSGAGNHTLCSITFQANERACLVTAKAYSSTGDAVEGHAVGCIVPDDGTGNPDAGMLLLEGHSAITVAMVNNRIDFIVGSMDGQTWRGYLKVEAVHDYSA